METPNDTSLESAVTAARNTGQPTPNVPQETTPTNNPTQTNTQEEIGFHKGALNTLVAERNELAKMIGNVEAIMGAHVNRLKELGIDVTNNTQEQPNQ